MSWATLHADTFNRANAELNGATMSDASGTWVSEGGNSIWSVSSNQALSVANTWGSVVLYDSAMSSSQGDQYAQVVLVGASGGVSAFGGGGPVVRYSTGAFYYVMRYATQLVLYKAAGSYPGTALATYTVTAAAGDVLRLEAVGGALEVFLNGVSQGSPVSDSSYTTGRAAIWQAFTQIVDTFEDGIPPSLSQITCAITGTSSVAANLKGAGALACVSSGAGTCTATLVGSAALALAAAATSSVTATLVGAGAAALAAAGSATVTTTLRGAGALTMTASGSASVSANAGVSALIACAIAGSSSVAAALTREPTGFRTRLVEGFSTQLREGFSTKLVEA